MQNINLVSKPGSSESHIRTSSSEPAVTD